MHSEIGPFMHELWLRKMSVVTGHSLLFYDYFLTLGDETNYIWGAPWTSARVAFLISRYGNLVGQSVLLAGELGLLDYDSPVVCDWYTICCDIFIVASVEISHVLVLLKAWALWRCHKAVAVSLLLLYTSVIVAVLIVSVLDAIRTTATQAYLYAHLEERLGVCIRWVGDGAWAIFVASLLLDTALVVVTLRSLWQYSKAMPIRSSLLQLLFRDACLSYAVSVLHSAFTIVCWTLYSNNPEYLLSPGLTLPLVSITAQRAVLNLRSLEAYPLTTCDLSKEVRMQMAVFRTINGAPHTTTLPAVSANNVAVTEDETENVIEDRCEITEFREEWLLPPV